MDRPPEVSLLYFRADFELVAFIIIISLMCKKRYFYTFIHYCSK